MSQELQAALAAKTAAAEAIHTTLTGDDVDNSSAEYRDNLAKYNAAQREVFTAENNLSNHNADVTQSAAAAEKWQMQFNAEYQAESRVLNKSHNMTDAHWNARNAFVKAAMDAASTNGTLPAGKDISDFIEKTTADFLKTEGAPKAITAENPQDEKITGGENDPNPADIGDPPMNTDNISEKVNKIAAEINFNLDAYLDKDGSPPSEEKTKEGIGAMTSILLSEADGVIEDRKVVA